MRLALIAVLLLGTTALAKAPRGKGHSTRAAAVKTSHHRHHQAKAHHAKAAAPHQGR